jgi:AbrB family looped-hinge helix DNA binding protein
MSTTIDKAGRVVIPAPIRSRAGFIPGAQLEIMLDDDGSVRIERRVTGPKLVREGNLVVSRPTVSTESLPEVDVDRLIAETRVRWP